jgi:predicted DNA-binding protein
MAGYRGQHDIIYHHLDYTKPLEVVALCQPCHRAAHAKKDAPKSNSLRITLEPDLSVRLRCAAKRSFRSQNQYISFALMRQLERDEDEWSLADALETVP